MMHKVVLAITVAAMLCGSTVSGTAFTVAPLVAAPSLSDVHSVTFWGQPFPYGYNWSRERACTRHLPVETPQGHTSWQRVWVCGDLKR